jgi:hypothetical protein
MANGYLGKISAIVSANTADFDGKLSKSAKEVSSFARSVQSNLTSASRQAARSLEGIYTPLQKFERSLQAAASMKLSFKGFPGMIKDLDSLQSRLNSALSKRQVDIVLKTTGMSSVSALRDAISGLKSKDIELIARVGGIDKLKELGGKIEADVEIDAARKKLADLTADAEAAKAKVASIGNVPVAVKVNAEGVDSLKAKLEEARGAAGKLMGGEFMGQKSLNKAISGVSAELVKVEAELARAAAAKKTLETMSSGPRSKPEELNRANERVSTLAGQKQELDQKLAELEKYRDSIKTVMREIKQAEAGGGATAGGGDIAAAKKEEAAAIRAVSRAAKELQAQITAKYGVDIDLSDLEQLISRGGKASDVLERLPALMDELGRSDLEAASNKMRQLVSVSEELSDPIKAAQATLTGLAKEVQAGFLPALVQSQSELESLNALIEEGIAPSAAIKKNFDQVKATVDATVASVRQLAEVSDKAGRLKTGRELVFAQPALSESLDRGAAVGNKAAGLPASAISSSPRLVESLVTVNQLTREAEAAFAKLQMKANVGLPTGSSQRSLDLLVAKLNEAISTTENLANAQAEAKSRAAAAADSEIANFIRVQQAAKTAEQERIAQAQKVADSEIANLQRVQQAAKAAEIERQAQAQKVADSEIANLQRVQQAAKAAEIERQAQSQKVADSEIANLQRVQQAAKAAEIERQAQAQKVADSEIANLQRVQQAAKAAEIERQSQSQRVADSEIANLQRVQQAAKTAELERQAQAQKTVDAEVAILQRRAQAEMSAEQERQARAQMAADSEIAMLIRREQAARDAARGGPRGAQAREFQQSFGGAGAAGLNLGLDQRALQGYNAQLQILQGAISRASAEARGPAVAAFERMRNAVATAFDEGNIDAAATRQRLAGLRTEAVAAAAAAGGVRVGALTRDVARAGDVGRGGFDRFGLALNQAGYAIDDFMSSTGGLEFKLRAVSNNVTQLAFILGGTTGLFVGLGAVIAGQAAVALIKFMNSGRSAEDQTKALNDALAKQKSLVDGLAESHKALADAILRGTTSSSSESERKIVSGQADLRRQSAELSAERKAAADTAPLAPQSISRMIGEFLEPRQRRNEFQGVAELRAELNKLEKQLQAATTVGERATIQGRIRDTGRAELATRGRLASEQTPDATVVQSAIRGSAASSERASGGRFLGANSQRAFSDITTLGGATLLGINRTRAIQQNAANEGLRGLAEQVPTSVQGQIEALRRAQELKRPEQAQADYGFVRTSAALDADREIARFEAMIQSLQKAMEGGIVDSASKTYAASVDAANSIRAAQEDVADAIKKGVPSALAFQSELDKLASELASADDELKSAVTANPDDPNVTPQRREDAIKRAQDRVESVNRQRADVETRAREVRLGRTFGGERTTRAISSLDGNERFTNEQAGLVARLKRVVDDEVQARRKASEAAGREAAIVDLIAKKRTEVANSGGDINKRMIAEADIEAAQADLEKAKAAREAASAASNLAQKASEAAAALAEAAAGIEAALTRIRKVGDSALQRSEQGADAAQRAFEENPLRAGGRAARDAAEERLINDRSTVGNAQASLDNRRREIQQDPQMQAINGELEAITQRRKDLEAKSATGGGLNRAENAELDAATKREIELIRQREMVARQLTEAERKQIDAINNGILAREKELEKGRQRAAEDPTFKRSIDAANQIMADSERQANEAQQRYINNPSEKNRKDRDEADARLRSDRQRAQELQDNLDNKRKEIEKDPAVAANNKAISANDKRLADLAEKEAKGGLTDLEIQERKRIQGENRRMRGENEAAIGAGTRDERKSIDDEQYTRNQRDRALRGRDLGLTDRERFRKEFAEGAGADINARAKEMRDNGENPQAFLRQAFQNQMESVAPMMKQFQDERQNAILQGRSRAALNVSDVSTSQGASELTRLLRGDDSAKDVNLAELRKQSGYLEDIRNDLKANNPGVLL